MPPADRSNRLKVKKKNKNYSETDRWIFQQINDCVQRNESINNDKIEIGSNGIIQKDPKKDKKNCVIVNRI